MSQPSPSPSFGARFAEAWATLQDYLADLDHAELKQLATADRAATLSLLQEQPQLRGSSSLEGADAVEPEELALKLVRERLDELVVPRDSEATWGARFLAEWRALGAPISTFRYAVLQELKRGDRDATLAVLLKLYPMDFALRRQLEGKSPERTAAILHAELRARQHRAGSGLFWPMMALFAMQ